MKFDVLTFHIYIYIYIIGGMGYRIYVMYSNFKFWVQIDER